MPDITKRGVSPWIAEDLPDAIVLTRDGVETRIGKGGITYHDLAALRLQRERLADHRGVDVSWPLSPEHVRALFSVLWVFPGARVEDWA